jgi:hypothetical protein
MGSRPSHSVTPTPGEFSLPRRVAPCPVHCRSAAAMVRLAQHRPRLTQSRPARRPSAPPWFAPRNTDRHAAMVRPAQHRPEPRHGASGATPTGTSPWCVGRNADRNLAMVRRAQRRPEPRHGASAQHRPHVTQILRRDSDLHTGSGRADRNTHGQAPEKRPVAHRSAPEKSQADQTRPGWGRVEATTIPVDLARTAAGGRLHRPYPFLGS